MILILQTSEAINGYQSNNTLTLHTLLRSNLIIRYYLIKYPTLLYSNLFRDKVSINLRLKTTIKSYLVIMCSNGQ